MDKIDLNENKGLIEWAATCISQRVVTLQSKPNQSIMNKHKVKHLQTLTPKWSTEVKNAFSSLRARSSLHVHVPSFSLKVRSIKSRSFSFIKLWGNVVYEVEKS